MRKEADFVVTDRIIISVECGENLLAVLDRNSDEIRRTTLADELTFGTPCGYVKEWDINGEKVALGVKKA